MDKMATNRVNTPLQTNIAPRVNADAQNGNGALFSMLLQNVDAEDKAPAPKQADSARPQVQQDAGDAAADRAQARADKVADARQDRADGRKAARDKADDDQQDDTAAAAKTDKPAQPVRHASKKQADKKADDNNDDDASDENDDTVVQAAPVIAPVEAPATAAPVIAAVKVAAKTDDQTAAPAAAPVPPADATASAPTPAPLAGPVQGAAPVTPSSLPAAPTEATGKEDPALLAGQMAAQALAGAKGKQLPNGQQPVAGQNDAALKNDAAATAADKPVAVKDGAAIIAPTTDMPKLNVKAANNDVADIAAAKPATQHAAVQDTLQALAPVASVLGDAPAATPTPLATIQNVTLQSAAQNPASIQAAANTDIDAMNGANAVGVMTAREAAAYDPAAARLASAGPKAPVTATLHNMVEQVSVQLNRLAKNGEKSFNVQLQPAELGRIEVRLDIAADGKASATIIADSQSALDVLQKDSASLTRALSDAGLQFDSNSLSFNLRDQNQNSAQSGAGQFGRQSNGNGNGQAFGRDEAAETGTLLANTITMNVAPGRVDIRA